MLTPLAMYRCAIHAKRVTIMPKVRSTLPYCYVLFPECLSLLPANNPNCAQLFLVLQDVQLARRIRGERA